jgi:hypothetical protein
MMAAGEVGLLLTECRANDSAQPSVVRVALATFFGLFKKGARSEISLGTTKPNGRKRLWRTYPLGDWDIVQLLVLGLGGFCQLPIENKCLFVVGLGTGRIVQLQLLQESAVIKGPDMIGV